jgi:hypothetical protein
MVETSWEKERAETVPPSLSGKPLAEIIKKSSPANFFHSM